LNRIFRADRSGEEVCDLLNAILNRSITDEEWDDFISIKIIDPKLEKIRDRMEEIWTEKSVYRIAESIDPADLNPKGVAEVRRLIESIRN